MIGLLCGEVSSWPDTRERGCWSKTGEQYACLGEQVEQMKSSEPTTPPGALSVPIKQSSVPEHETAELHSGAEAVSRRILLVPAKRFVREWK